jgi:cytochrome c-type biogenesis protein CcmE
MTQHVESFPAIPDHLVVEKGSGVNVKFIVAGLLLVGVIVVLIVQGVVAGGAYFMTVGEVHAAADLEGKRVRVNGAVVGDSETWDAQTMILRFAIEDEGGDGAQLPIVFHGPRPDNFQRAVSAIVEGELLADGSFQADTLLLKCPSRYEEDPEEVFVESFR